MTFQTLDISVIAVYFLLLLGIGIWKGRGSRGSADSYFVSKGMLPWWAIGMAYIATGMNTEQLIGQNGMGYTIGLTMVNWYLIVIFVFTPLIFVFFPIYLRNNIKTMPEYLGRRFDKRSENVFAVVLLASYILMNLAVVFYGGAKVLQVVFGINLWVGLAVLGLVAGVYTMYGGMSSMIYAAVFQFALIFIAGLALFILGYLHLPNGWQDVVQHAPGGFHLIQPMDYETIPWHAIVMTVLGLHLFYSCMNQALVQRGFGARSEWDVRIAILFAGSFAIVRPFVEIFPGMIARALAFTGHAEFVLGDRSVDDVFPMLVRNLVPVGLRGLMVVGILSSVMSTISAYLNSISTLITYDVYRKWINNAASDRQLVRVGMFSTLVLMVFSILYSPLIGRMGGIFNYFQMAASYLAVPFATVFLFGMFWKRATPAAALTVIIVGVPIGILIRYAFVPLFFSASMIEAYSLDNFFVLSGVNQMVCSIIMVAVSLCTEPRPFAEISSLLWSAKHLRLPPGEPRRPLLQSVGFWWVVFMLFYIFIYIVFW